jgi:hypothetical protein
VWGELVKEGRKEGSLNSIVSLKLWVQSKTKQNSGDKQRMLRVVCKKGQFHGIILKLTS